MRPVHTLPRRHRQGAPLDETADLGRAVARRVVAGDGGRVDLRARAGSAEPGAVGDAILSTRDQVTNPVSFTLNGRSVVGRADERLIDAAARYGIEVPRLCDKAGMRPDGNCRACVVEIKGDRVLAPSCCRYPSEGMVVT